MTILRGTVGALLCLVLLAFLYAKTQTVDLEERESGRRYLSELQESICCGRFGCRRFPRSWSGFFSRFACGDRQNGEDDQQACGMGQGK